MCGSVLAVQVAPSSAENAITVYWKKKELAGNFANGGREWARAGQAPRVLDHDFPGWAEGRAIPYGFCDLAGNEGFVSAGDDHDTPAFAAAALESWWVTLGRLRYPGATRLLVTADSGGSGAARSCVYKKHLAAFAGRHHLDVTVLHYPSGTTREPPSGTKSSTGCSPSSASTGAASP